MDKEKRAQKASWAWLPAVMPGVAGLMQQQRKQHGEAHVRECWRRGVVELQPGWFYAREGAVAVGVPFEDDEFKVLREAQAALGGAMLQLRLPEVSGGA